MKNIADFFKTVWSKRELFKKHRYLYTLIAFVVWVAVFDQNSVFRDMIPDMMLSKRLEKEKEVYLQKIHDDSIMLNELQTNDENLKKFAREQYFMKADDEDVFIVIEKN